MERLRKLYKNPVCNGERHLEKVDIPTYTEGIQLFLDCMLSDDETIGALSDISKIEKVGFKTVLAPGYSVHVIDEQVEARMREFLDVAPAHNGPYLEAVFSACVTTERPTVMFQKPLS